MRPRGPGTLASAAALGLAIAGGAWPAQAVVRFEPTPAPTAAPPLPGGRVTVGWAGVALDFPADWTVRVKPEPARPLPGGASVLVAFGHRASCSLDLYDPRVVESWTDVGVEPTARLTVAGHPAERFDKPWSGGQEDSSAYTVHAPGLDYSLLCVSPDPPADRWRTIIDSLELSPTDLLEAPARATP